MAGDKTTQQKQGRQAGPMSSLCILLCLCFKCCVWVYQKNSNNKRNELPKVACNFVSYHSFAWWLIQILIKLRFWNIYQSLSISFLSHLVSQTTTETRTRVLLIRKFHFCQAAVLLISKYDFYVKGVSNQKKNQLPVSVTRGQCYKTFLSVIYKFLY